MNVRLISSQVQSTTLPPLRWFPAWRKGRGRNTTGPRLAGQGGTDPATGKMPADIEAQTEQCLRNVEAILKAAGSSLQHVLRCGVFLIDMGEFQRMNGVYARIFGDHRPARTTIQAAALPLPGLRVEIDCIAYIP